MKNKQEKYIALAVRLCQSVLIGLWLMLLRSTDAYWSVYVLCAGAGLLCLWRNPVRIPEVSTGSKVVLALFALIFAGAVVLANYSVYLAIPGLTKMLVAGGIGMGSFVLAWQVLLWGAAELPRRVATAQPRSAGTVFWLCFAFFAGVYLLYLFTAAYPGYYTPDSFNSLMQIRSGEYVNNHPFWYTMLIGLLTGIGDVLFESTNGAMAVYSAGQILLLAAALAYAVVTLYQSGCSRLFLVGMAACYGLLPYNIAFSVTMWKDIPFSLSILVMVTALYRILKEVGNSRRWNYILFALGGLGLCLMRTNGLAMFAATALVLLFAVKGEKRKLLVLMAVLLVFSWILTNPVLDALDVGSTDFVEILAVPMQQIARVITNGYSLSEEDYAMLSRIGNVELIPQIYTHESVDPIKQIALYQDQKAYLQENLAEYGRLWIRLGMQHPGEYLKAWIELTKGYWNAGYEYWIYYIGGMNAELGITRMEHIGVLGTLFAGYFAFVEKSAFLQPFMSIGLQVWLLLGCLALNLLKKREEFLLTVPLLVLVMGLWLGTPVFAEFRYAYPLFLAMPLLLGVTLFTKETAEKDTDAV